MALDTDIALHSPPLPRPIKGVELQCTIYVQHLITTNALALCYSALIGAAAAQAAPAQRVRKLHWPPANKTKWTEPLEHQGIGVAEEQGIL